MSNTPRKISGWRVVTVAVAISVLAGVIIPVGLLLRTAALNGEESGQRALLAEVRTQLHIYHSDRGSYPRELAELHIIHFGDGSSPATLREFNYVSDGATYTLSCYGVATRKMIVIRNGVGPE